MYIQRLTNEKYRVREMYNGVTYSIMFDFRPTQKEARKALMDKIEKDCTKTKPTQLGIAANQYIESKTNLLSPETIRNYKKYLRQIPDKYKKIYISDITNITLQNMINDYALDHKPKTVRSYWNFINVVIKTLSDRHYKVLLPHDNEDEAYIPTQEEVELILKELKGTKYFTPIYLAAYGLRRGEIMALSLDDVSDCRIRINKSLAQDEHYNPIIKSPKTKASNRIVPVPKEITDKIKRDGVIYDGSAYSLNEVLHRIQDKYGIKRFSIHKLRHYLATTLHYMNKPKRFIESFGGWETNSKVLEKVYTHTKKVEEVVELFDLDKKAFL